MKKIWIYLVISLLTFMPMLAAACEAPGSPISSAFNAQIISTTAFRAKGTMTRDQIQKFLEANGSALASYQVNFSVKIGPGDTVDVRNWWASDVIFKSADWYNVNPQVILATLQKESSLVKSGNLNNLNKAMGYDCPETKACSAYYANFPRQIDGATYQLDFNVRWSDVKDTSHVGSYYAGNEMAIDGRNVTFANSATAALYRYTPHRPDSAWINYGYYDGCPQYFYGNYNFISNMLKWFPANYGFEYNFTVTASLYLSNIDPTEGDSVSASYVIKNTSSTAKTIDLALVDYADDANGWNSFPLIAGVTIQPGATYNYRGTHFAKYAGIHHAWLAFRYNGGTYNFVSSSGSLVDFRYRVKPFISQNVFSVTASLYLSNIDPKVGDTMNASYVIKNISNSAKTIDLALPDYADNANAWNSFPIILNITIQPGATYNYRSTKLAKYQGIHHTWLAYRYNGGTYNFYSKTGALVDFVYRVR